MQGLFGPMNWLVHPESTLDCLLSDGLRTGTRVLQECKLFKTKEFLGLTVPCLYQGAGLNFLCVPTSFVVASSFLLVDRRRSGTISTIVVAAVATFQAVVVVVATRGLDACSAKLLVKVGDGILKLGEVLKKK